MKRIALFPARGTPLRMKNTHALWCLAFSISLAACGKTDTNHADAGTDGGFNMDAEMAADLGVDAAPQVASTAHCAYVPIGANANGTGALDTGTLSAGAAEGVVDLPVGSAMGGYSERATFLGSSGLVGGRVVEYSGSFVPSYGIETRPRVKALALTAGTETVVLIKADLVMSDDNITYAVTERLGPSFNGKVVFATSHTHAQFAQYSTNMAMAVGLGVFRRKSYDRLVDAATSVAMAALANRVPAQIGIGHDPNFDPMDLVSHDRRTENDVLPNGAHRKDHDLFLFRVDRLDNNQPIALMPLFGVHGTVLPGANNYASTEAPGAIERALEEHFTTPVVVMHLQGAAGDVSPSGTAGIDCGSDPICYDFARVESVGRNARDQILALYDGVAAHMKSTIALEMLTRSVPLGPDWRTFNVRGGALEYAPFDGQRVADRQIWDDAGVVISPIDEFNASVGAAFCGKPTTSLAPRGQLPGTRMLEAYGSCSRVDALVPFVGALLSVDFGGVPVCGTTRTTVSALRIDDHVVAIMPGEPVSLFQDEIRNSSPVDAEHTIVLGYSQGHIGYQLTPEDWLLGGYEPSINIWGPLEGQYLAERAHDLLTLAANDTRDQAMPADANHNPIPMDQDSLLPAVDPAPTRGTIPTTVPSSVYARGINLVSGTLPTTISRFGFAKFVWIGEDPLEHTPDVTLEADDGHGNFSPVTRQSGRAVTDGDFLLSETPDPVRRASASDVRTHYWVIEWQAVPGIGWAGFDDLATRAGLPLGNYRFHVEGAGYTIDSPTFVVSAAPLAVTVAASGSNMTTVTAAYTATNGYRLLSSVDPSNGTIYLRGATVNIAVNYTDTSGQLFTGVVLDANGSATLNTTKPVANAQVTDAYRNTGTGTL